MDLKRIPRGRKPQPKEKIRYWKSLSLDPWTLAILGRRPALHALWSKAMDRMTERNREIRNEIFEDARLRKNWLKQPILTSREHGSAAAIYIELRLGGAKITKKIIGNLGLERDWQALNALIELYK